ncbi:MAG: MFS transporter [Oscillospiraceae bacterium]|nr:MFS transporter [Oscillospiraceae bacterium]
METAVKNQKNIKLKEYILYMLAVFFYTNMTGMINEYRRAYLVDGLKLTTNQLSFFNVFTGIAGFVISFVCAMILDNKKIKNGNKFKNIGMLAAVPCGLITILIFWTPGLIRENPILLMVWLCALALIQCVCFYFGNTVSMVAVVMSPDSREREQLLSFRGIVSAVGNSAPLVIVLVVAAITKALKGNEDNSVNYLISAILCGVVGTVTMLLGMRTVKERITYSEEKRNPLEGFVLVFKNRHARRVLFSEFLKAFRGIATFMQPFIAAAMLGSSSKTLIFALPVGIGTMTGMLIINALLKKFTSRTLYIASGLYSVIINLVAFGIGYLYITRGQPLALNIVFVVCLFGTGLQFGASNLLPNMFQADILDDLELTTGKRLDATLPFVISIGSTVSTLIANGVVPYILYDNEETGWKSIIGYQQGLLDGTQQSVRTKVMLLFFYTVVHGIMMLLAGLPFLNYKLYGEERDRVHSEVLKKRESLNIN